MENRVTPHITVYTGGTFEFMSPESSDWTVWDIAHALALTCRFAGHCTEFYSVAQHSVLVSRLVPGELALAALFHDASEAFLGDIPTPLKPLLPDFQALERRVEAAVADRLQVVGPEDAHIRTADRVALATERRDLMPQTAWEWEELSGIQPVATRVRPIGPNEARSQFLERMLDVADQTWLDTHAGDYRVQRAGCYR